MFPPRHVTCDILHVISVNTWKSGFSPLGNSTGMIIHQDLCLAHCALSPAALERNLLPCSPNITIPEQHNSALCNLKPEMHYITITQGNLSLCKIWCFHGRNYKECRLLGYKNPVPTSQETRYSSATEPSQVMLCNIWCFHGADYEKCRLLGC
jgi:hypothetical protein